VWGAAESYVARDLRGVLRDERGMPSALATARGYWLRTGDWVLEE
jgi:NADPH-dependent ferric siderophore reductase